jgi:hypothetical protein
VHGGFLSKFSGFPRNYAILWNKKISIHRLNMVWKKLVSENWFILVDFFRDNGWMGDVSLC